MTAHSLAQPTFRPASLAIVGAVILLARCLLMADPIGPMSAETSDSVVASITADGCMTTPCFLLAVPPAVTVISFLPTPFVVGLLIVLGVAARARQASPALRSPPAARLQATLQVFRN